MESHHHNSKDCHKENFQFSLFFVLLNFRLFLDFASGNDRKHKRQPEAEIKNRKSEYT